MTNEDFWGIDFINLKYFSLTFMDAKSRDDLS